MKTRGIVQYKLVLLSTPAGYRWQFLGPQATLYVSLANDLQQQITTHFLSANPAENGTARATWMGSFDSSQVWARAIANSTDANYVAPNSIPWLKMVCPFSWPKPFSGTTLIELLVGSEVQLAGTSA